MRGTDERVTNTRKLTFEYADDELEASDRDEP